MLLRQSVQHKFSLSIIVPRSRGVSIIASNLMHLKPFVEFATVSSILKKGGFKSDGYRLLDCTYPRSLVANRETIGKKFKGEFEKLLSQKTIGRQIYLKLHIPSAVHVDLDIATYPTKYARYAQYPPNVFQEYARLLGLNSNDHIITYGRDGFYGMVVASRVAWLFKSYGHEKVSVLNGLFEQWEKHGGEVSSKVEEPKRGNWKPMPLKEKVTITFDEMHENKNFFNNLHSINLLDCRPREQFNGDENSNLPADVPGCHVEGSINTPAKEVLDKDGFLKSDHDICEWLTSCGYNSHKPTTTICVRGLQASLLAMVLSHVHPTHPIQLYSGSLEELSLRQPSIIAGGKHFKK
ncbi:hypothetical protein AB6A40_002149 [Gnathostoma spinigerum]|uniref:Rhodanese domain-containing protein n=1 Tax=Gnathostoma spinigerum TaxID=75299 RepID=A0ABD6E5V2_9BILA